MNPDSAWWSLIGWGLFPLWLAAGFADWLCHRAARIEKTSGTRESSLHILLFLLVAVAVLLLLLFEVTSLTFAIALFALLGHQAVSLWDTSYSQPRRFISPVEQQIHGFLDLLPLFALALVAVLEWEALRTPQWRVTFRETPAYAGWALVALAGGLTLILEEWWRCRRNAIAQ